MRDSAAAIVLSALALSAAAGCATDEDCSCAAPIVGTLVLEDGTELDAHSASLAVHVDPAEGARLGVQADLFREDLSVDLSTRAVGREQLTALGTAGTVEVTTPQGRMAPLRVNDEWRPVSDIRLTTPGRGPPFRAIATTEAGELLYEGDMSVACAYTDERGDMQFDFTWRFDRCPEILEDYELHQEVDRSRLPW